MRNPCSNEPSQLGKSRGSPGVISSHGSVAVIIPGMKSGSSLDGALLIPSLPLCDSFALNPTYYYQIFLSPLAEGFFLPTLVRLGHSLLFVLPNSLPPIPNQIYSGPLLAISSPTRSPSSLCYCCTASNHISFVSRTSRLLTHLCLPCSLRYLLKQYFTPVQSLFLRLLLVLAVGCAEDVPMASDMNRRNHIEEVHGFVTPWAELNGGLWSLFVGATIFLALRFWCKITRRHGLWYDDYILVVSWVSPDMFLGTLFPVCLNQATWRNLLQIRKTILY